MARLLQQKQEQRKSRRVAEGLIALAVKEKDNYETVTVKAKVARKDADGKNVKEVSKRQEGYCL